MEKRDLGVHVAKVKETSVSCFILLHFLHTLTLPECNEFHKKKITSYDINNFSPSPAKPLSFENDGDGVRIHQRRTSYKLIFLEINKVNKYRRFFFYNNSSLPPSRHFLPCCWHEKQYSNFSNKPSSICSCNVWDKGSITGLVLSYQPVKALGDWRHSSSKHSKIRTTWR